MFETLLADDEEHDHHVVSIFCLCHPSLLRVDEPTVEDVLVRSRFPGSLPYSQQFFLMYGLSEVRFQKDVARTNVSLIPRTVVLILLRFGPIFSASPRRWPESPTRARST